MLFSSEVLIAVIIIIFPTSFFGLTKSDNNQDCGIIPKPSIAKRITNGQEAQVHLPWMVQILWKDGEIKCAGALISRKKVLTAAHCFCTDFVACVKENLGKERLVKDFSKLLILGGSKEFNSSDSQRLNISRISVHPWYDISNHPQHFDLAILTLQSDIETSPKLAPICLPSSFTNDLGIEVMTANWSTRKYLNTTCITDLTGPVNLKPCYNNLPCEVHEPAPRSDSCKDKLKMLEANETLFGMYDKVNIDGLTCFKTRGAHGWCYTENEKSFTNWGFCVNSCDYTNEDHAPVLEEFELETFENATCFDSHLIDPEEDLCIAGRLKTPKVASYETNSEGHITLTREEGGEKVHFFKYVDTCRGDSGSPVWFYDNNKAYIVGVVSKGPGCIQRDKAGIAARVKTSLRWIRNETEEGERHFFTSFQGKTTSHSINKSPTLHLFLILVLFSLASAVLQR